MHLPLITEIEIQQLDLYKRTLCRRLLPGINVILGGNGIGKTTFVYTTLFGLFGKAKSKHFRGPLAGQGTFLPDDYFDGRVLPEHYSSASVKLTFSVSETTFSLVRTLRSGELQELKVDGADLTSQNVSEMEAAYIAAISSSSGMLFDDFAFMVTTLLFFGEDRETLLWHDDDQNRVLRLLFLDSSLDESLRKAENEMVNYDTKGRHKSEERKNLRAYVASVEKSLAHTEEEGEHAEHKQSQLNEEYESLEQSIATSEELLERALARFEDQNTKLDHLSEQRVEAEADLQSMEQKFFSKTYGELPPTHLLLLHSFIADGNCQLCGQTHASLKQLGRQLMNDSLCVACRLPLLPTEEPIEISADEVNAKRAEVDSLVIRETSLSADVESLRKDVSANQTLVGELKKRHQETKEQLDGYKEKGTGPNLALQKDYERIDKLTQEIDQLYVKRDLAGKKVKNLNKQVAGTLEALNKELSDRFSGYGSQFLGMPCQLVIRQSGGKKPRVTMLPRFKELDRRRPTDVSESQQFFLDQAFRMALLSWMQDRQGEACTYIVETPEGSLDRSYEANVARMYNEFALRNFSIVLTSNLNSSRFLMGIYSVLNLQKESEIRTLRMLEEAALSDVQRQALERGDFDSIYLELGLEPVNK